MTPIPPAGSPPARLLSPRRKTTAAPTHAALAAEQVRHFGLDPAEALGGRLAALAERLYDCHGDVDALWQETVNRLAHLPRGDRLALFNAQKFLSFQLAKLLDLLQAPTRASYQSIGYSTAGQLAKGPYPTFDNVAALFSANPVITRTATYIFACAEWIDDAFQGREFLHEIYSRLLNPTSIALANHIVDLECGPQAPHFLAWNFNSGMAAIDAILSHLLGREDIVVVSRHIYGGTHQLLHDWFARPANLGVALETFDGTGAADLAAALDRAAERQAERLAAGRKVYVYLESPCNPHGLFLDVPAMCREAHRRGLTVLLDSTVATPFLVRPLREPDPAARPDYLIHSYTKDLTGGGNTTAGVVIGRAEDLFLPKGETGPTGRRWDETVFWNVYYVKGAFLEADKAFEVLSGMKTLEVRMLQKCLTTRVLASWLAAHPEVQVHGPAAPGHANAAVAERLSHLGLPAPLFTFDLERLGLSREAFEQFFDGLAPTFGHMVSLGQSNTVILCPALTSHSELSPSALAGAGITPTTVRVAVGDEPPRELIRDFLAVARRSLDPVRPGFSAGFPGPEAIDRLCDEVFIEGHRRQALAQPRFAAADPS